MRDFEELFDIAKAFDSQPLPRGYGAGAVSITGVGCVLAADCSSRFGLELPKPQEETLKATRRAMPDWAPLSNPADI